MSVELVNRVALLLFSLGVLLGFGSTAFRLVRLHRAKIRLPRLIWRDVAVFAGLALAFLAIGVHRVLGAPFSAEVWWAASTATVAIAAVWIYVIYEFFVVGHRRDGRPYTRRRDDETTTKHGEEGS